MSDKKQIENILKKANKPFKSEENTVRILGVLNAAWTKQHDVILEFDDDGNLTTMGVS